MYENPFGIDALATIGPIVISVGTVIALVSAFSTVIAVRQRFKRATGEERQQMRWLAFVASLAGVFFVLQWVLGLAAELFFRDADAPVFELLFALTALTIVVGVPAAYLVAIFRHGLWNLDVVVKKTVQYAIVLAAFAAIAGITLIAIPLVFVGVDADLVPAIVIGLFLAAAFAFVRPRAQRLADRLVYGRRSTPYEVLSAFAERVGETFSTEDVLPRMAQLLAAATGARVAAVWLRIGGNSAGRPCGRRAPEVSISCRCGAPTSRTSGSTGCSRSVTRGSSSGRSTVEIVADDPMNPTKERLARDMASQAGLVLRNVRLIEELRESRRRIVSAQDDRARTLERNIHDGAQQQLVALSVGLRLAGEIVDRDPAKAKEVLGICGAGPRRRSRTSAISPADLPAAAGRQGAAVRARGAGPEVPRTHPSSPTASVATSQDVESAVYFCCLEAMQTWRSTRKPPR